MMSTMVIFSLFFIDEVVGWFLFAGGGRREAMTVIHGTSTGGW